MTVKDFLVLGSLMACVCLHVNGAEGSEPFDATEFDNRIRPFLDEYCFLRRPLNWLE